MSIFWEVFIFLSRIMYVVQICVASDASQWMHGAYSSDLIQIRHRLRRWPMMFKRLAEPTKYMTNQWLLHDCLTRAERHLEKVEYAVCVRFPNRALRWCSKCDTFPLPAPWLWLIYRHLGYGRVYMPLYQVADTPFHIQDDDIVALL